VKIPEIAGQMRQIAEQIQDDYPGQAATLLELVDELRRRVPAPRAPATSTPMTPELAQEIREYAEAHADLSHQEIAEQFNVNHGRVSEALHGKRQ
jgi:hypothetical protein